MGKYFVFLLLISVSCISSKKNMSESTRHARKYEKLSASADKARLDYLEKVNKKSKGASLDRARRKMLNTQARVEKYKTTMKPSTKHRNDTH